MSGWSSWAACSKTFSNESSEAETIDGDGDGAVGVAGWPPTSRRLLLLPGGFRPAQDKHNLSESMPKHRLTYKNDLLRLLTHSLRLNIKDSYNTFRPPKSPPNWKSTFFCGYNQNRRAQENIPAARLRSKAFRTKSNGQENKPALYIDFLDVLPPPRAVRACVIFVPIFQILYHVAVKNSPNLLPLFRFTRKQIVLDRMHCVNQLKHKEEEEIKNCPLDQENHSTSANCD